MTGDPEDRPPSFTLGHDLTRLVLAAYQRDPIAQSAAAADILAADPGLTLVRCLPAILEALHVLGEGTPMVTNGGIDVLREQLALTYELADRDRTQEEDQ
jgi:hypothetical protein